MPERRAISEIVSPLKRASSRKFAMMSNVVMIS
jgi:hypothetical protein